jgi:hypothetical protein
VNTATRKKTQSFTALGIFLAAWLFTVVWSATSGELQTLGQTARSVYALLVVIGIVIPTVIYFQVPAIQRSVDRIGVVRLTLFHIWRIPASLLFFYYGFHGELPATFWVLAGVGDLATGLYASTALKADPAPALLFKIHVFGLIDFMVALGTGLTYTLLGDPRMKLLTDLPMALIPLYGVGISGATHIIALSALLKTQAVDTLSTA